MNISLKMFKYLGMTQKLNKNFIISYFFFFFEANDMLPFDCRGMP